jgi:hypothetical protein
LLVDDELVRVNLKNIVTVSVIWRNLNDPIEE